MLCDFAGISSFSSNKFLSAEAVSDIVSGEISNPMPDIIKVGNGKEDTAQYKNFFDMTKFAGDGNIGHIITEIMFDMEKENGCQIR